MHIYHVYSMGDALCWVLDEYYKVDILEDLSEFSI